MHPSVNLRLITVEEYNSSSVIRGVFQHVWPGLNP